MRIFGPPCARRMAGMPSNPSAAPAAVALISVRRAGPEVADGGVETGFMECSCR
jgi:hypothetical protein